MKIVEQGNLFKNILHIFLIISYQDALPLMACRSFCFILDLNSEASCILEAFGRNTVLKCYLLTVDVYSMNFISFKHRFIGVFADKAVLYLA